MVCVCMFCVFVDRFSAGTVRKERLVLGQDIWSLVSGWEDCMHVESAVDWRE